MQEKNLGLEGTVMRGLGEGAYFISMKHYKNEIKKKVGFDAYPGTLNLKVGKKQMILLKNLNPIKISGFKSANKSFGDADCYKAKVEGIDGAVIMPELTKHKNIIELIAPVHIKSSLKIKDGDKIKVIIQKWQK